VPADIHSYDPVLKEVYEGKPAQQVLTNKLQSAIEGLKQSYGRQPTAQMERPKPGIGG
jgi:hypothetical protein